MAIQRPLATDPAIQVLPSDLEKLRRLQSAIQMQEDIVESLKHEQERLIQDGYGVDLKNEAWELDLDQGKLSKSE